MTQAENADYRNIFYRRGSTLPEWIDPSSTCDDLMFNLSSYDDMPDMSAAIDTIKTNRVMATNNSLKNLSPNRFKKSRRKSKLARAASRRNRKR